MAIYSFTTIPQETSRAKGRDAGGTPTRPRSKTRLDPDARRNTSTATAKRGNTTRVKKQPTPSEAMSFPQPKEAEAWFREQEKARPQERAQYRDRFIGALPRELTPEQCLKAVERFCRDVTQDRVPWHFALHLELDRKTSPTGIRTRISSCATGISAELAEVEGERAPVAWQPSLRCGARSCRPGVIGELEDQWQASPHATRPRQPLNKHSASVYLRRRNNPDFAAAHREQVCLRSQVRMYVPTLVLQHQE